MRTGWRGAVKRLITTMFMMTILLPAGMAMPAAAQAPGGQIEKGPALNLFDEGSHRKTDVEVYQERDRESAYKSGMSKIPDKKVKSDPWGAVRTTPPTASATK
jgi:hypothetical protein